MTDTFGDGGPKRKETDKPTTAEIRGWFKKGVTYDSHTAYDNCGILLDKLEALENLSYSQYQCAVDLVRKQRRMRDKWADGNDKVKGDLWKNLHESGRLLAESLGIDQ